VVLSLRNRPGDKVEEEQLERLTLERRRQVFGDAHLETAQSLNNLAVFHLQREGPGDLETATNLFTEALAIRESELGADHPWVANTRNNLANVLLANGRPLEAETLFRRAIDGWSASLGPEHVRVATGWWGLSRALEERGDLEGALEAARRTAAIDARARPVGHPDLEVGATRIAELERLIAQAGVAGR
jgi:tetratricopeptide (TPR) repeat protein